MATYGYGRPAYAGYNPLAGRTWTAPQQEYIRQNPGSLNQDYLNRFQPGSVDARYRGFLQTWLGDQANAFEGYKLQNPEAQYEQYLGQKDPWNAYETRANPYARFDRLGFGTRMLRRQ